LGAYACKKIIIKGCYELWNVDFEEFTLFSLLIGVIIIFKYFKMSPRIGG
jgi:hypothetical protein